MINVDPLSAPLTSDDWKILAQVEPAIVAGDEIKLWWERNQPTRVAMSRFPAAIQTHRPDWNYGFLQNANLRSGLLPVAGVVQGQLYDYPKAPNSMTHDPLWVRSQVKAFILNYFMRLTSAVAPSPNVQNILNWSQTAQRYGWGYQQIYYKLKGSGLIGKFWRPYDIISLPEVGTRYEWVVFLVNVYHFDFVVPLAGANGPKVDVSTVQPIYTVMTPNYVVNREKPETQAGVLGEYGYGYSVVPDPTAPQTLVFGPSSINNTIELLHFRVLESGEVRAEQVFITPQPTQIVQPEVLVEDIFNLADLFTFGTASKLLAPLEKALANFAGNFDPVYQGIRFLNLATLGLAAEEFCVSKLQLFKMYMYLHFYDAFNMYNLSASHFRMVSDWTDPAKIPEWAKRGTYGPGSPEWQASQG